LADFYIFKYIKIFAMSQSNSRRRFLRSTAAIAAGVTIIPRQVLGRGFIAPSDQLTKGIIGLGGMGRGHIGLAGTRVVALCDVDQTHLAAAAKMVGNGVKTMLDYHELIAMPEVDIVHIATPPHWHGIMSIEAAKAVKDIWCEKPMTRTIGEGKRVVEAVKQHGSMFRLNTWFRFQDEFYGMKTTVKPIKKLVESGMLGWPLTVTVSKHTGFDWKFYWVGKTGLEAQPVPQTLDYDRWLGPAPYKPYNAHRVHGTFRGYWDYDGGGLGDMGQHYLDPIQYFLGKDHTSPVKVEVDADQQHPDACGTFRKIIYTYADGCKIILDGEAKDESVAYIEGPEGKLFAGFKSTIPNLKEKLALLPDPVPQVTDFLESVKYRTPFALNESNGHRSCTIINLGKIALQLGRTLNFNPETQEFIGDEEANKMINPPMRAPYGI
jgi:predicted dehydrogenase